MKKSFVFFLFLFSSMVRAEAPKQERTRYHHYFDEDHHFSQKAKKEDGMTSLTKIGIGIGVGLGAAAAFTGLWFSVPELQRPVLAPIMIASLTGAWFISDKILKNALYYTFTPMVKSLHFMTIGAAYTYWYLGEGVADVSEFFEDKLNYFWGFMNRNRSRH